MKCTWCQEEGHDSFHCPTKRKAMKEAFREINSDMIKEIRRSKNE